jgi:Cytochrome c7 and related cytochrome c
LSAAHESLDGPTQCTNCHSFGLGARRFQCTSCHKAIQERMDAKRGYHARVADLSKEGRDCAACHTEHFGREFAIVHWPQGQPFRHEETGYRLEGKHAGLACEKCHNAAHVSPAERQTIKVRDPNQTFLGLSTSCVSCHQDEHHGQLGEDCARCHDSNAWKPASRFDHSRARFSLTGRHATVTCAECHARTEGPVSFTRFVMDDRDSCAECHRDPHQGAFRQSCESCHTTVNWQPGGQIRFDHSATRFPLAGNHSEVACSKCHLSARFSDPVAHERCMDCHTPDPHKGQFRDRPDGGDCASCHDENGFKPALFTMSSHQETAYPLLGKHRDVRCDQCHVPAGRDTKYRIDHDQCQACHKDEHAGQFSGQPHIDRCEDCHTVDGFQPSTFSAGDHTRTRFALAGGHRAVACVECHQSKASSEVHGHFRFDDLSCPVCHENPHGQQFSATASFEEKPATDLVCTSCHTERSWKETAGFDHAKTTFPLAGAHQRVACVECHRNAGPQTGIQDVMFGSAPEACSGCHEDVHAGQFDRNSVAADCGQCHTPVEWKQTTFDHEKYSSFSLTGAHERVACGQCHLAAQHTNGRRVTTYRGTPRECAACHSEERPRKNFPGRK